MEQSLVQILVVVANIQMRTLKTEVEKGSARTVIDCGSVGPKRWVNSCYKALRSLMQPLPRKGIRLIFLNLNWHCKAVTQRNLVTLAKGPGRVIFSY